MQGPAATARADPANDWRCDHPTMIEIESLSKRYGDLLAVDDISFTVKPGEVLGFLGPNGAGKSTTMRMIAGFLAPTQGRIRVCGHDIEADPLAAKRCIGYLPEGAPAYGEMTPRGFLSFIGDMRGMAPALKLQRIDEVTTQLGLKRVLEQPIETLSKGFRRRVGIAQALLHDPKVLILDEPTDGLDPNQKHEVRELIGRMSKDRLMIISTHILEEVHAVCTRAIIIAGGKLLADATPDELERRSRYYGAISLRTADPERVRSLVGGLSGVAGTEYDAREQLLTVLAKPGQSLYAPLTQLLRQHDIVVQDLTVERGRLDEVFRTITSGGRRS
jgi:ABC-2 type transport system ATP-binding protein